MGEMRKQVIEIEPQGARSTGLFVSYPPLTDTIGTDGAMGLAPYTCETPAAHQQYRCPTPASRFEKVVGTAPYSDWETCLHFSLIAGVHCSTVGDLAAPDQTNEALIAAAARRLRRGAAFAVGQAMSTGKAWKPVYDDEGCATGEYEVAYDLEVCYQGEDPIPATPFCLDDPIIPCDDPVTPTALISNLEARIGDLTGGRPTIYLPTAAAAFMVNGSGPVERIGNTHRTRGLGTDVVFGYGFMGWGPDGTEPDDGTLWGVLKGAPVIFRSGENDPDQSDGPSFNGIAPYSNERGWWVEEDFSLGYEPCPGRGVAQMMELC